MLTRVLALALLLTLASFYPTVHAQTAANQQAKGILGVGDWVNIRISGQADSTSYVSADGTINVPLIGNIPVAGIAPGEAANRVAKALRDGGFFVDPQVAIESTQPQGQTVSVLGEVGSQGNYPITPRTSIFDLLARAGGVKETGSDIGYVVRKDESGQVTRHPVNLSMLTDSQAALPSVTLVAGDSLVVPPADHFTVIGEVKTPGRYRIDSGMTVLQALARAGGISERGSARRIQVQRADKPGHIKTSSAKSDDLVKPDDIIIVKESLF